MIFCERSSLEKFTSIEGSKTAIPHLNTCKSQFRHLETVNFLKRKVVSPKVQYHALGGLMADLINKKNPENNLNQLLKKCEK